MPTTVGASRASAGLLAAVVVASACASPSRTSEDYRRKVQSTAEAMTSPVATAILAASAANKSRLPGPAASTTLDEAEADAVAIRTTFGAIQPPPGSDVLRQQVDAALGNAVDGIATLRIAARRGELDRLAGLAAPLGSVTRRLTALGGGR